MQIPAAGKWAEVSPERRQDGDLLHRPQRSAEDEIAGEKSVEDSLTKR